MQIIEVTGFGVRSAVIRLRSRSGPMEFVLYPMLHMARPSFYRQVALRLRRADVVVVEGVGAPGDRPSVLVLALALSYRILRFNRRVGLVEQDIDYAGLGVPVVRPDVSAEEFRAGWRRVALRHRILIWITLPVVLLVRLVGGAQVVWTRATEQYDLPTPEEEALEQYAPEIDAAFLGERDERLVAALCRLHEERGDRPGEIAVVYGAAHMPAIVRALRDRYGYRARSADWLTITDL